MPALAIKGLFEGWQGKLRARTLFHQHFDIAVLGQLDLEVRLKGFVVVARDGDIFAFGEDERGEGADQFANDVAAGRQDREGCVGERVAARAR